MGTIISLIIGGFFCTFSLNDAIPFIFRYGWAYFFYLLGIKELNYFNISKDSCNICNEIKLAVVCHDSPD